jgi:NAD(P)-dependent dehydrogenase (short-subunit alcohol dehydrogenase family)
MNINTKAVFLACQVFGKHFIDEKVAASIINLGSMSGLIPLSRVFTYSMSKGAVHNLSKNLAREWAPLGIRVNTLVPGFFPAEQNKKVLTPDRVAKIMSHTPMNRFGEAKELVAAAAAARRFRRFVHLRPRNGRGRWLFVDDDHRRRNGFTAMHAPCWIAEKPPTT